MQTIFYFPFMISKGIVLKGRVKNVYNFKEIHNSFQQNSIILLNKGLGL